MKSMKQCQVVIVTLLVSAIVVGPVGTLTAHEPPAQTKAEQTGVAVGFKVLDVAATKDGSLQGRMYDPQGQAMVGEELVLVQQDQPILKAITNAQGEFAFRNVKPGLCQVIGRDSAAVYRVWSAQAAPPAASQLALMTRGETMIRGQLNDTVRRALLLGGLITVSGVIGGVIGYNVKDDAS